MRLTTFTKRHIDLSLFTVQDVCIEDVAHHLACINRFNGALARPVSVAQHAVYVSRLLDDTDFAWAGLHHDDAEAYVGDITKWLKHSPLMQSFRDLEERVQAICYRAFNVDPRHYEGYSRQLHPMVEWADRLMVRFEAQQSGIIIQHPNYPQVTTEEQSKIGAWAPWSWRQSEEAFLVRVRMLADQGEGRSA